VSVALHQVKLFPLRLTRLPPRYVKHTLLHIHGAPEFVWTVMVSFKPRMKQVEEVLVAEAKLGARLPLINPGRAVAIHGIM